MQINLWVRFSERCQIGHEHFAGKKRLHRQAQCASRVTVAIGRRDAVQFVDEMANVTEQGFASLGQRNGAMVTMKQWCPDFIFKRLYLMTDGRGRDEKLFGGRAKTQVPCNARKSAQATQREMFALNPCNHFDVKP